MTTTPTPPETENRFFHVAYEKVILASVLLFIWTSVLMMEKVMPRQSLPFVVLGIIALYGIMISIGQLHHRRKMAKGKVQRPEAPEYLPAVAVIIPAHNEALVIGDTLDNLMALNYKGLDILVMDDRSHDGTAQVLAHLSEKHPGRFRYCTRPTDAIPGKSAVLNDALQMTHSDILVVFDADARIEPDFIHRALPYLADPEVGAVQVRKVISNAQTNILTRCQHHEYALDAHFQSGRDAVRSAVELRGNGQLIKRQALLSIGGWTEDTITDDLDLSTKLHLAGWDIRFIPDVLVQEEGITRFWPLLRQRRRWAEGSLKRYLDYLPQIIASPTLSRRAQMDMLAYFAEFLFPIWFTVDLTVQLLNLAFGEMPNHLIASLMGLPALGTFFFMGTFAALRQLDKYRFLPALWLALESSVFMLIVWIPVVSWITIKVLFARNDGPLNWGKTEHLGAHAHVKQSRVQRIKQLLQKVSPLS